MLEELGIEYDVRFVNLSKNEQKEGAYVDKLNPNGRTPSLLVRVSDAVR